jgi:hypothetical protein
MLGVIVRRADMGEVATTQKRSFFRAATDKIISTTLPNVAFNSLPMMSPKRTARSSVHSTCMETQRSTRMGEATTLQIAQTIYHIIGGGHEKENEDKDITSALTSPKKNTTGIRQGSSKRGGTAS